MSKAKELIIIESTLHQIRGLLEAQVKEGFYPDLIREVFEKNQFKELFLIVKDIQENSTYKKQILNPFYGLINEKSLNRIWKDNAISSFLDELHSFLWHEPFNEQEKKSFLNQREHQLLEYALTIKKYNYAEKINSFREDKDIFRHTGFIVTKLRENDYAPIEKLIELSTNITYGNSELLRLFYFHSEAKYDYIKNLIHTHKFDINAVGRPTVLEEVKENSFTQLILLDFKPNNKEFLKSFLKDFGEYIDFNVKFETKWIGSLYHQNILELILRSKMNPVNKLEKLQLILEICPLSEKHIGQISTSLIEDKTWNFAADYYDHPVYEDLFSHEKFNSHLFDRASFLNNLLNLDKSKSFQSVREQNNFTINPTSVLIDKFSKLAKPAQKLEKHPFINWIKGQTNDFSRDTLKSLIEYYREELTSIGLEQLGISGKMKKIFEDNGLNLPEKPNFFSHFFRKLSFQTIDSSSKEEAIKTIVPKIVTKFVFNDTLLSQVKDFEIIKYVDAIKLNYEQYQAVAHGGLMHDNEHYMNNLLPKFINSSIETYLHFATINEEEAKKQIIVQLKILNKKTFEVLNEELNREHEKISHKTAVQKKIMQQY